MNNIKTTIGLREDFIQYFRANKHKLLKPSPCFPDNDPTLFFTSAGMVQLKPVFLGTREFDPNFSMLSNSQICIRAGGKKCDLDDVGYDNYHCSRFEMLGNWSLNNYWKEEAIQLAFNYLIKIGLNKDQMYATYFEGNDKIPVDIESRDIWKKYLNESHIVPGSTKDNFWSLGSGPCGPCTEIHYDLMGNREVPELVNKDDPTVIELWNIVLIQYNEIVTPEETNYELLEKRFIDTGAGLERLAMVVQGKTSIYQTDTLRKIIKYVEILSDDKQYEDKYGSDYNKDISFRIFADHIRTLVIALYDGARFDCNGRGFILRKVIRRLLVNYYIYLNNCVVKPVMKHHIIEGLITEILNFHNFYKHDSKEIKRLLVEEECMFIDRLNKFKLMYNNKIKKNTKEYVVEFLLNNSNKLKEQYGVDKEIINNISNLVIEDNWKKN